MSITPGSQQPDAIGLVGEELECSYTNRMFDWIALAPKEVLPANSVVLYWVLKSFIIDTKGAEPDRVVQITQEDLADIKGWSVDTVQRALKPLYVVGLVEDKERRKISTRVPGKKKPVITTLLIMKINACGPPPGYEGWLTPYQARKVVRASRAELKAQKEAEAAQADKAAGQSDAADLRSQSEQPTVDNSSRDTEPVDNSGPVDNSEPVVPGDNSPNLTLVGKTAGQCDTADLLENGADLLQNGADLRCIGSNPSGTNPSGKTGGRDAAPQTPTYRPTGHPAQLVTDQLEFVGNHQSESDKNGVSPERETPGIDWTMWGIPELRQELQRRFDQDQHVIDSPGNVQVIKGIQHELRARGLSADFGFEEIELRRDASGLTLDGPITDELGRRRRPQRTHNDRLSCACPTCGAAPSEPCRGERGPRISVHKARLSATRSQAPRKTS
jgi:hypothetical protein